MSCDALQRGDRARADLQPRRRTASRRSSDFGAEHLRTGALILYTSQDSVLQIAAHVDGVARERAVRRRARAARELMSGEHASGA